MRLFTVHPDHSIDQYIMGYVTDLGESDFTAQLIVHDLMGEIRPIGSKIAPLYMNPIESVTDVPSQIKYAVSHHAALILYITQPMTVYPPNFHPALSLHSFCCGELICNYNQNQLASLWFMDYPGCIVSHGIHWSLTPDHFLLPTQL